MTRKEFCVRFLMPSLVIATVTAGGCGSSQSKIEENR